MDDSALELRVRVALEARGGRAMTDEEWHTAKERLLDFFRLLQEWERNETKGQASE